LCLAAIIDYNNDINLILEQSRYGKWLVTRFPEATGIKKSDVPYILILLKELHGPFQGSIPNLQ
jgi:hypothetical protein